MVASGRTQPFIKKASEIVQAEDDRLLAARNGRINGKDKNLAW
jgi:hypothetical protein